MVEKYILLLALMAGNLLNAQQSGCKVLVPRISGTYQGECRKGLAQGKGVALGIDRYEGEFRKGLPDGLGIYHWADGSYYEGYWKQGLRDGTGTMIFTPDSTLKGFWKADKYAGKEQIKQYEVIQSRYVARSSFSRTGNTPLQVKIKFTLGGVPNNTIQDLSMTYSSGEEFRLGTAYGIQNVTYPLTVRIQYRTWNVMRTVMTDVTFEFRISEPGSWDVNVQN
jgi:hypothetical protein